MRTNDTADEICGHLPIFQTTSSASKLMQTKWKPRFPTMGFILLSEKNGQCPVCFQHTPNQVCLLGAGDAIPLCLTCRISLLYDNGCSCAQKHKFPPSKNSSFSVIAFALAVFQVSSFVTNIAVAICHIFWICYIIDNFLSHIPMLKASRIYAVLQPEYPLLSQGVFRCGFQSIGI